MYEGRNTPQNIQCRINNFLVLITSSRVFYSQFSPERDIRLIIRTLFLDVTRGDGAQQRIPQAPAFVIRQITSYRNVSELGRNLPTPKSRTSFDSLIHPA